MRALLSVGDRHGELDPTAASTDALPAGNRQWQSATGCSGGTQRRGVACAYTARPISTARVMRVSNERDYARRFEWNCRAWTDPRVASGQPRAAGAHRWMASAADATRAPEVSGGSGARGHATGARPPAARTAAGGRASSAHCARPRPALWPAPTCCHTKCAPIEASATGRRTSQQPIEPRSSRSPRAGCGQPAPRGKAGRRLRRGQVAAPAPAVHRRDGPTASTGRAPGPASRARRALHRRGGTDACSCGEDSHGRFQQAAQLLAAAEQMALDRTFGNSGHP